jgi:transposase
MRPKGSAKVLSQRRRRALQLVDDGVCLNEVARRLSCNASSVMRWRNQRAQQGEGVYTVHASPGRPARLDADQKKALSTILLAGAPAQGYRTDLWTTARVADVIHRVFGVTYHRDHVGRVLHDLGFSCQKPDRRALERNDEEIERWKRDEWPRIKRGHRSWLPTSSSSTKAASF